MCGIAGLLLRRNRLDLRDGIRSMIDRVRHRGPDTQGEYLQGRVALGHCRLSVVDLSPAGKQPMLSADGRYAITYNGELYNYIEIRSQLRELGIVFRTATDTE